MTLTDQRQTQGAARLTMVGRSRRLRQGRFPARVVLAGSDGRGGALTKGPEPSEAERREIVPRRPPHREIGQRTCNARADAEAGHLHADRLQRLVARITKAYDEYEFHVVYHAIHNFCAIDLSAVYLDIIKDRLYTWPAGSPGRRSAQTVLYETINVLTRLLTPILAFTTEEIWRHLPLGEDRPLSVQLASWPQVKEEFKDNQLQAKWDKILQIRDVVGRALEKARQEQGIGNSLNAAVQVYLEKEWFDFLKPLEGDLSTLLIVSQVSVHPITEQVPGKAFVSEEIPGFQVLVKVAPGEKCERCWNYSVTVGQEANHPTLCSRCVDVINQLS